MYFVKLFKYNKWLFIALVCFFFIQLFINVKRGLTATPFLHYGMYSGKFYIPGTINGWKLYVNDELLNLNNNLPETNDRILQPLNAYQALEVNGTPLYNSHIQKYLSALHIPHSAGTYRAEISKANFKSWYKEQLQQIIKREITRLQVYQVHYTIKDGRLLASDSTQVLLWN